MFSVEPLNLQFSANPHFSLAWIALVCFANKLQLLNRYLSTVFILIQFYCTWDHNYNHYVCTMDNTKETTKRFKLFRSYTLTPSWKRASESVGRNSLTYLLTYLLTYSMVQSPSWEANWFAASREIPRISRNPKVHYRTHKRPQAVPILGQPNPVHIPISHLIKIHLNIIHLSTPRSPQWSLSLQFPHQDHIHPLSSPIRATYPAHLIQQHN